MSSIPFPVVPTTVYAASTEVKSADLNSFEALLVAAKVLFEAGGEAVNLTYDAQFNRTAIGASTSAELPGGLAVTTGATANAGADLNSNAENFGRHFVKSNNGAVAGGAILYRPQAFAGLNNAVIMVEARVAMNNVATSNTDVWIGLKEGATIATPAGATDAHVAFVKEGGDTNWQTSAGDGAAQTRADSGTPPVVNVAQVMRIEYHGANTVLGLANGTAPVALFYINGVLEATVTSANVPKDVDAAGGMFVMMGCKNDGGGAAPTDITFWSGPIKIAYNQALPA